MNSKSLEEINELYELKGKLDIEKFRKTLSHPMINLIRETIDYTRSHETGLEAWLNFLDFAVNNRQKFNDKENAEHLKTIYSCILHCLDCLDRWEEYIDLWEKIFTGTDFVYTFSYSQPKNKQEMNTGYFEDIDNYIISETEKTYCVHFLYCQSNRKKIIEQKLAKKMAGKKTGNLFHARQEDLSGEEISTRYERMKEKAQYVEGLEMLIRKASNKM